MLGKVGKLRVGCTAVVLALAVSGTASAGITTELVSVGPNGVPANGESDWPSISANGGSVAFSSLRPPISCRTPTANAMCLSAIVRMARQRG